MKSRVEQFAEFHCAMDRAKELARRLNEVVSLTRNGNFWTVLIPASMATAAQSENQHEDDDASFQDGTSEADDEYHREVVQPILDEMRDDQDSFARSEEDGWYYED